MAKDSSGEYFSKSDEEHVKAEKPMARGQHNQLRHQFLEKAKKFMDDTPLGETKNLLNTLMGKESQPEATLSRDEQEASFEEDWEDDWEGDDEEEEFDYTQPETIRVGYDKPGSKPPPKRKTVEEARDESFDLKFGALSGLLNRFGAEGVEEEKPEAPKQALQIDMELFRASIKEVYAKMAAQSGESPETDWLRPELLSLLRLSNSPQVIMEFIIAALFSATPENFMTQSDIAYVYRLMTQIGIDLPAEEVENAISQTFLFAERVHRLYQKLVEAPPQIMPEQVLRQKETLAKLFIHQVAQHYQTDHKSVIRTLAERWTAICQILAQHLQEIERINQQLSLFKDRKTASSTIWAKLLRVERLALDEWGQLTRLGEDILALKKVTLLLEEHEALAKLALFPLQYLLSEEALWERSPSWEEIQLIFSAFHARKKMGGASAEPGAIPPIQLDLSPLNQKKMVTRAKAGEVKALKEIDAYKRSRTAQVLLDLEKINKA